MVLGMKAWDALEPPRHRSPSPGGRRSFAPAGRLGLGGQEERPSRSPRSGRSRAATPRAVHGKPRRKGPHRPPLRLPRRELSFEEVADTLRRFRRDQGLFQDLSISQLEAFAEACVPLGFGSSELLFSRGEPASWFGILLSGRVEAAMPDGLSGGGDLPLGEHAAGAMVGVVRASMWQQSHTRAYALRASEEGWVAVMSYDQLESFRHDDPALHHALLRALLSALADSAACFFHGCLLSGGVRWPLVAMHERRVLQLLLPLRDSGLFAGVDHSALLALACRLRVTQWLARESVMTRGSPAVACLLVLDGKLTAFRESGGPPTEWFGPGDCVGLESVLGAVHAFPVDVFAARPTLAALLLRSDLEDLGRECPGLAVQILHSLFAKLFAELSDPHGKPLLLLADGTARMRFDPGDLPALRPVSAHRVGNLSAQQTAAALRLAEATVPVAQSATGDREARVLVSGVSGQTEDDVALQWLLGEGATQPEKMHHEAWLLGSFLSRKLAQQGGTESQPRGGGPRGASPPKPFFPAGVAAPHELRKRARSAPHSVVGEYRRWHDFATDRSRLPRDAYPRRREICGADRPRAPEGPTGLACPRCGERLAEPLRASSVGHGEPRSARSPARASAPGPAVAARPAGAADPLEAVTVRVVSADSHHGNTADFYLSGRRVPLDFFMAPGEAHCPGLHVVTVDPVTRAVASAACYDTDTCGQAANAQLAADLEALPRGRIVLVGLRGSGLDSLDLGSLDALRRIGASAAITREGRPHQSYALIAVKGVAAVAERRGLTADVEARLPVQSAAPRAPMARPRPAPGQVGADARVAAEDSQAWQLAAASERHNVERLQSRVQELEAVGAAMQDQLAEALRERDEWKASALRLQLNREFSGAIERAEASHGRHLNSTYAPPTLDFEKSVQQQLRVLNPGGW